MSKLNVKVSILISYYNQRDYIADSILSVIDQNVDFIIEIICGDDGSTDGSIDELHKWQKKFPELIKIIEMPRNNAVHYEPIVRVSNIRFAMMKESQGEFIIFLDGDDYFCDKNRLKKQVAIMEKYKGVIGCGGPCELVDKNGNSTGDILGKVASKIRYISPAEYWAFYWFHAESFMFRNIYRDSLSEINQNLFDDNLITAYYLKHGGIVYIPDIMICYRQTSGSSWNERDELRKAFVNITLYEEAKHILPNLKIQSFVKIYPAFHYVYLCRKKGFSINCEDNVIKEGINKNVFVHRTQSFYKYSFVKKVAYYLQYGLIMNCGPLIRIVKRLFCSRSR